MRILVVDDDKKLCKNITAALSLDLYSVDGIHDGEEAIEYIKTYKYDLLVLDWMLPGKSGIDICEYARKQHFEGGILMLTAKDSTESIIEGLDKGADDYIIKPFKVDELLARVRAILRRKNKMIEEEIKLGSIVLNKSKRSVFIDNFEVNLTKNEYLFIEFLIENKGQVVTHEQIINYIWSIDDDVTSNTLAALVRLVRRKIDLEDEPSYIESIRGLGYRMRDSHV